MFKLARIGYDAPRRRVYKMAGIRNAPDVTGTATYKSVSFHWVDASDDRWSESYKVPVAVTNAQIEAVADALQAESAASLYWIEIGTHFGTRRAASAANAVTADAKSASVFDSANFTHVLTTSPVAQDQIVRVPAPMGTLFVLDAEDAPTDNIDGAASGVAAIQTATEAMLGSGWQAVWARYSEKTEINEKTSLTAIA